MTAQENNHFIDIWLQGIRSWWHRHKKRVLRSAVPVLALISIIWLGYEFWRMIFEPSHLGPLKIAPGAIDLKFRYNGVHNLFAGVPELGVYPPASYVILWPLLGWLEIKPAILMWAATTVFLLGWLVVIVVKESGAETPLERLFVGLVPLSMYATGATIGNGQLAIHILPVLISGILLLRHQESTWETISWRHV